MDFQYQPIIDRAEQQLKASLVGQFEHVKSAFKNMEWTGHDNPGIATPAQVSNANPNHITIYPAILREPAEKQTYILVKEFGIGLYRARASKEVKKIWEEKRCYPEAVQIDAFQDKLKSASFETYPALIESYERAMDRLVAVNLANALIFTVGKSPKLARNLDIRQYGSTAAYANIRNAHSIVPLVYAYGTRDVADCPGHALAELVCNDLGVISESTVKKAFKSVITRVFDRCR